MPNFTVAIVGGGASGTLAASVLTKRSDGAHVVIIEPREQLGRGVAYSTECPKHLLNVPAGKMSALPDLPDHFVRWLATHAEGPFRPASFVPRSIYGEYLNTIAAEAQAAAPYRWRHVKALALEAREEAGGIRIACSNGDTIFANALVVASGNASPAAWPRVSSDAQRSLRFFNSAWDQGAIVPGSPDETVLLLGMGLTAVDAVFGLRFNGHRGAIYMVSRRGLLPHEHRVFDTPPSTCPEAHTVSELMDSVRTLVRDVQQPGGNWRAVIDNVRPRTNALWKALSVEEQRRFMRHALPFWNVHRHRIAPEAAKDMAELMAAGTVRMLAGRTLDITASASSLSVPVKVRGSAEIVTVEAGRVINCSGPQHDFRKLSNPLIQSLLAQGLMVPNPLDIGVRVAESGAFIDAEGTASNRLFALGPARFGTLIETTAIPEIRVQATELAELLCATFDSAGVRLAG
jgi:uncharacterized NAD(P)/FAD-binding protein YdhS